VRENEADSREERERRRGGERKKRILGEGEVTFVRERWLGRVECPQKWMTGGTRGRWEEGEERRWENQTELREKRDTYLDIGQVKGYKSTGVYQLSIVIQQDRYR
jgi:hypothetical protein